MPHTATLRRLIDECAGTANIGPVTRYITDHPDIDLNAVTGNQLSALWWALTPPKGMLINPELISYFSTRVNIVQAYLGHTPREYLVMHHLLEPKKYLELIQIIRRVEDQHVVVHHENNPPKKLQAFVNNNQNVHDSQLTYDTEHTPVRTEAKHTPVRPEEARSAVSKDIYQSKQPFETRYALLRANGGAPREAFAITNLIC